MVTFLVGKPGSEEPFLVHKGTLIYPSLPDHPFLSNVLRAAVHSCSFLLLSGIVLSPISSRICLTFPPEKAPYPMLKIVRIRMLLFASLTSRVQWPNANLWT
jgi:hypothetical protein